MLGLVALSLLSLAEAEVEITSKIDCPSQSAISEAWNALGRPEPQGRSYAIAVDAAGRDVLRVIVRDTRAKEPIADRTLEAGGDCAELARAVAVAVSAWMLQLEAPSLDAPIEIPPGSGPRAIETSTAPALAREPVDTAPAPALQVVATVEPARARRSRSAKHEAFVLASFGVNQPHTTSTGVAAAYAYWLSDAFALELHAQILDHDKSDLGIDVRNQFPMAGTPPIADLYELGSTLSAGAELSLARGPVSLFGFPGSELELLGLAGAGIGSVELPGFDSTVAPVFNAGLGLRIYVLPPIAALRAELRDVFFSEQLQGEEGLTHNVQLQVGLQISTDPEAWSIHAIDPGDRGPTRHHLVATAGFGSSFVDTFVQTQTLNGSLAWYFHEFFAIEALGMLSAASSPSGTSRELLMEGRLSPPAAKSTELEWGAGGGIRVDFLRGRFAPFGTDLEGDVSLHGSFGLGFGGTRAPCTPGQLLDPETFGADARCPTFPPGGGSETNVYEPTRTRLLIHAGGGLRFGFGDHLGIDIALRDWIFDSRVVRPESTEPSQRDTSATRHILLAELALSFAI